MEKEIEEQENETEKGKNSRRRKALFSISLLFIGAIIALFFKPLEILVVKLFEDITNSPSFEILNQEKEIKEKDDFTITFKAANKAARKNQPLYVEINGILDSVPANPEKNKPFPIWSYKLPEEYRDTEDVTDCILRLGFSHKELTDAPSFRVFPPEAPKFKIVNNSNLIKDKDNAIVTIRAINKPAKKKQQLYVDLDGELYDSLELSQESPSFEWQFQLAEQQRNVKDTTEYSLRVGFNPNTFVNTLNITVHPKAVSKPPKKKYTVTVFYPVSRQSNDYTLLVDGQDARITDDEHIKSLKVTEKATSHKFTLLKKGEIIDERAIFVNDDTEINFW